MNDIVERTKEYIKKIFENKKGSHDYNHTIRVYNNALELASYYKEANIFLISLAALLHDVDDYKIFNTTNNQNTRDFLESNNVSTQDIEKICLIINEVSFSKNKGKKPSSLEGKIVQDADRLDAIGAIGIARTFAFGGEKGRDLESSINHFHEKLLLIKDMMNTPQGKKIACDRHQFMVDFLQEYNRELN